MDQLATRHHTRGHVRSQARQHDEALLSDQEGSQDGGYHYCDQEPSQSDPSFDVDEQKQLEDRDGQESRYQQGAHGFSLSRRYHYPMDYLRLLPSVDALSVRVSVDIAPDLPAVLVTEIARRSIDAARSAALEGKQVDPVAIARREARRFSRGRLRRAINATGVLLHTNLGRAVLHREAAADAGRASLGYSNLEFDLAEGRRGSRGTYLSRLFSHLTGAEAAMVVNNNAAALFLVLHTLAQGASVPVSRGELIEIGGSYRLPDLMAASGARLLEVGTTNRTRIRDYESGLRADSRMLLKVHPSNYRVVGFSEETRLRELVELGRRRDVPVVYDVGSGLLDADVPWVRGPPPSWIGDEPGVRQVLAAGADLVTFSGDKLFGGCQAGVIAGRSDLVSRLKSSPVARAVRVDGPTIAALARTAEMYASGRAIEIPFWHMVTRPVEELSERLEAIAARSGLPPVLRMSEAMVGAGSVPGMTVPSPVLAIERRGEDLWPRLLEAEPAVVARRSAGDLLVDVRAVGEDEDGTLSGVLRAACRS